MLYEVITFVNLDIVAQQLDEILAGNDEGKSHSQRADGADHLFALENLLAEQTVDNGADKREERYEPKFVVHLYSPNRNEPLLKKQVYHFSRLKSSSYNFV